MLINKKLKNYIENNIFPSYKKNDMGHNLDRIKYVIDRSMKFAKRVDDINYDMVYTIAAYHDIGHYIDAKNHEKISAEMLLVDKNLKEFFDDEQIKIMADAVYDHRASNAKDKKWQPRSIYGKIVSSADRNTLIEVPLQRTYAYRVEHSPNSTFDEVVEECRQHIIDKFGNEGYAADAMYFRDLAYKRFLEEVPVLTSNKRLFRKKFMEVNRLDNKLVFYFNEIKRCNPNMSLDELLYAVYEEVKGKYKKSFDVVRNMILEENDVDELEYYTKNVNQELKNYIEKNIFPEYKKNDGGHNITHILEVIRRSFALNDTFKLGLDDDMMYTIAACHDWGKYENHDTHNLIAAEHVRKDLFLKKYFGSKKLVIITDAIEDHRSSKDDEPRSVYGKLISSADRNTRIEIVFIRSFFVAKFRVKNGKQDNLTIEEYLDYTIDRLSKKYDLENPENMFFEDQTYKVFIQDMRALLKNEEEFKKRYCEVNNITSRDSRILDEAGVKAYTRVLKRSKR